MTLALLLPVPTAARFVDTARDGRSSGEVVDLAQSAQRPKTDTSDRLEIPPIADHDSEPVLDRRRRDQRVGKPESELTRDSSSTLRDRTIHGDLAERGKDPNGQVGSRVAGDKLCPRDHRVENPMASRPQLRREDG